MIDLSIWQPWRHAAVSREQLPSELKIWSHPESAPHVGDACPDRQICCCCWCLAFSVRRYKNGSERRGRKNDLITRCRRWQGCQMVQVAIPLDVGQWFECNTRKRLQVYNIIHTANLFPSAAVYLNTGRLECRIPLSRKTLPWCQILSDKRKWRSRQLDCKWVSHLSAAKQFIKKNSFSSNVSLPFKSKMLNW